MSVERTTIARWLGGVAAAGGAGIAALFCCAAPAAAAAGGLTAAGGILRNPWLLTAGILVVAALAIAALVLRRTDWDRVGDAPLPTGDDRQGSGARRGP
jgi:hypothetical protein